jgi:hypothetical protein
MTLWFQSKTPSIITEYVNNTDFKVLYPKFTDFDVRFYLFELLKVSVTPELVPKICAILMRTTLIYRR